MSGYLSSHGHTATVDLVVMNHYEVYVAYMAILDTYTDPEDMAARYRSLVRGLSRRQYSDLRGVDLDAVDFHGFIRSELAERALAAGK